jgi:hypothetical protein
MKTCGKDECDAWSVARPNAQTGREEAVRVSRATNEADNPNQNCIGALLEGALGVTDLVVTAKRHRGVDRGRKLELRTLR